MHGTPSVDLIVKCLENENECTYLYDVYQHQLQTVISSNCGVCPQLIAQLISKYAHSTKELHSIFRTKLLPQYLNDLFGVKSSFYRKMLFLNAASNLFYVADQTITSLKYLFHINNTSYSSFSFLFSILWVAFNFHLNSKLSVLRQLKINKSSDFPLMKFYRPIRRPLYGNAFFVNSIFGLLLAPNTSIQSLYLNSHNWIRQILSKFILPNYVYYHSFYVYSGYMLDNILYGAVNVVLAIVYVCTANSLIVSSAKPRIETIVPLPNNTLMKRLWNKCYSANNTGIRIQKFGLYSMSLTVSLRYLMTNVLSNANDRGYYSNQFVTSNIFHFGATMLSVFCEIVESTVPSFNVHFYYNKYILRTMAIIGNNIGYFYDLTQWISIDQNEENKLLLFWDQARPFDLEQFDWMGQMG